MQEPNILLGVPSGGHPHIDFVNSLVALVSAQIVTGVLIVPRLPVHQARMRIAHSAQPGKHTHILFIDDDMVFTPEDVLSLIQADKPIISGLYVRRSKNAPVPIVYDDNGVLCAPPTKLSRVGSTSLAFTLVAMDVLERTGKEFYFEGYKGEDMTFADEVRSLGIEWWIDPSVKIGHVTEHTAYPE